MCGGGGVQFIFFFKSSSSLHVAWAAITAAQGSVSEAINTLSGQLSFPVERGCWGMHWIHISPPNYFILFAISPVIFLPKRRKKAGPPHTAANTFLFSAGCFGSTGAWGWGDPHLPQQFKVLPKGSTSFSGTRRWPSWHKTAQEFSDFLSLFLRNFGSHF